MSEPGIVLVNAEMRETLSFLEPLPVYQNNQKHHSHPHTVTNIIITLIEVVR